MASDFLQSASVASGSALPAASMPAQPTGASVMIELEAEFFFRGAQDLDGFAHDFRADAVAGEARLQC